VLKGLINTDQLTPIAIEKIRTDGGTQPREGLDAGYIDDLIAVIENGGTLPPVDVMYDGANYWLYDGFHRLAAHKGAGHTRIAATVHQGDQAAAQWESYAANQSHGLRRSQADKERAIRAALKHPKGVQMANSLIAKHLGVSDNTVRKYREEMESASQIAKVTERQGADGKVYNTANIGANRPARQSPTARYEANLPALNLPHPSQFGQVQKMPIEDWELSDIAETVAGEYYGSMTRAAADNYTEMQRSGREASGLYWDKLQRALAWSDVTPERIQTAVADAVERLVAERRGGPAARPAAPVQFAQPQPYAEIYEIETALRQITTGIAALELRNVARYRGGNLWFAIRQGLNAIHYRDRDLVQALNNLASQAEQKAAQEQQQSEETSVDPWKAAWAIRPYDTITKRADRLVTEITPWAQAWRDDKGRTWRDVADRNPQHANSPLRQDLNTECARRGLNLFGDEIAETIRILFHRLQLDEPTQPPKPASEAQESPTESNGYASQSDIEGLLKRISATPAELRDAAETHTGRVYDEMVHDAWIAYHYEVSPLTASAALRNTATDREYEERKAAANKAAQRLDDRVGRASRLIGIYNLAISTEDEYGELTGCYSETLAMRRELQKLIARLERTCALLEGRPVEPMEACD